MARLMMPSACRRRTAIGDVVDRAKTLAMAWKGVMKTAADIEADAVLEREARGEDGAAGGQPEGLHHLARIGNFEPEDFLVAQGPAAQLVHVCGVVNQAHIIVGGRLGRDEIFGRGEAGMQETIAQPAELLRGEDVFPEIQIVAFVVNQPVRQHGLRAVSVPSVNFRLQRRHDRDIEDIFRRTASRKIVGGLGEPLQEGSDGNGAAEPLHEFVADIG